MNVIILAPAETELDEAIAFYESEKEGLGTRFLGEVTAAIKRIVRYPRAYQRFGSRARRCVITVFPYAILYQYREATDEILFVAIGHLHRSPEYWLSRYRNS